MAQVTGLFSLKALTNALISWRSLNPVPDFIFQQFMSFLWIESFPAMTHNNRTFSNKRFKKGALLQSFTSFNRLGSMNLRGGGPSLH